MKIRKIRLGNILAYLALIVLSLYFIVPFIWMFLTALKSEAEAFAYPPKLFPAEFRIRNFVDAWNSQPFFTFLKNSILVTVLTTLGQLISSSLVAYGFARFDFK
ncbi:MAG TPA: carbohydrate ABC transporter permease, partial [Rectinema sp.]|nr:carbohydrate ABC transporter permease [Rectinema sp.]